MQRLKKPIKPFFHILPGKYKHAAIQPISPDKLLLSKPNWANLAKYVLYRAPYLTKTF
jgi:hypothetical protein